MSLNQGPGFYSGEIVIPISPTWIGSVTQLVDHAVELIKGGEYETDLVLDPHATREAEAESAAEASWERVVGK